MSKSGSQLRERTWNICFFLSSLRRKASPRSELSTQNLFSTASKSLEDPAMTDVLGAASAALSLLDNVVKLIIRLRTAATHVKELPELLRQYEGEVTQARELIELVKKDESLQVRGLKLPIQKLAKLVERLGEALKKISGEQNGAQQKRAQQFWDQLVTGSAYRNLIDTIMRDMGYVKLDLIVRVQLAQVGITSSIRDAVQMSVQAIKALDAKLAPLGSSYPRLALLLDDHRDVDGFISVSREDLDHLLSDHGVLLQSNPASGTSTPGRAEKNVRRNNIEGGFVVAGPLCPEELDPWRDANYNCEENVIKRDAYALLHAQPNLDALNAMLKSKVESDRARYGK